MLGRKIAYNTIIAAGARVINLALSLIIIGSITRYLGQSGFGQYATILAFLYFFSVLADLGLYSICLREISRPRADEGEIASNAFTLRLIAGLFIFALAPLISCLFPYPGQVKLGILIGAVGFWLLSNSQVLMGVFQKHLRMEKVALAEFLGRLAQLGLVLFFIRQEKSFLFIVGAMVASALVNFLLVFFFSQKYASISLRFNFSLWRSLLKESLPLALAIVFTMVYFRIDTIMLSLMKGAADVGIYSLAYKILESLLFFPAMFIGLVMPLLSKYALTAKEKFSQVSQQALDILLVFAFPLIIGTLFLSPRIITLIAGQEFILSAGVLNILIFAVGIIFLGVLFSNMIISLKEQRRLTYIYGLGVIFNLLANFIFIPKYSYYGAAATTLLTELTVTLLMVLVLGRVLKKLPSFGLTIKYALAGLMMAGSFYLLPAWNLFILIILASSVYFLSLYLIGGFSVKRILTLVRKDV